MRLYFFVCFHWAQHFLWEEFTILFLACFVFYHTAAPVDWLHLGRMHIVHIYEFNISVDV